jgi:hypothetical protein
MARKPKLLTRLRVDEISSCDVGAGEGTRIVLMKRNRPSPNARRYYDMFKTVDWSMALISQPPVDDAIDDASLAQHLSSTTKSEKETTVDFMTGMTEVAKADAGMITIARNVVDRGETKLTEHQFTELLMAHAKVHKTANESDAAAFSQIFSAQSEDGILLRKACAVCKNTAAPMMLVEPVQSGGNDVSAADQAQAYAKLVDLAKALQEKSAGLSEAQAFSKAFEANPTLAAKAHQRPSATTSYEFPR